MAFSFGFGGDDIDDDIQNEVDEQLDVEMDGVAASEGQTLLKPFEIELEDLLATLPSSLTFRPHHIPGDYGPSTNTTNPYTQTAYPRRELHDIRAQIMSTADPSSTDAVLEAGLSSSGDLTTGVYEGGFKTWECSNDIAWWMLEGSNPDHMAFDPGNDFCELGAGTGLASCVVFDQILRRWVAHRVQGAEENGERGNVLLVADYNEAVLRMSTFPNLFLTWYCASRDLGLMQQAVSSDAASAEAELDPLDEGYLEITPELRSTFVASLSDAGIKFVFVAGSWGREFLELAKPELESAGRNRQRRVMASETIYAPGSLESFSQTALGLLEGGVSGSRAVVAAKKIYFGVGGGVDEFKRRLPYSAAVRREWAGGVGVGRWIGEVTLKVDSSS